MPSRQAAMEELAAAVPANQIGTKAMPHYEGAALAAVGGRQGRWWWQVAAGKQGRAGRGGAGQGSDSSSAGRAGTPAGCAAQEGGALPAWL